MFTKIMVPVDLAHASRLEQALQAAADLAHLYEASVVYAGVTSPLPGAVAHNPGEFAAKLDAFAAAEAAKRGIKAAGHAVTVHDPSADLDAALLGAVQATGADLVVMASHVPGVADYLFPSHGGSIAEKAKVSVLVVRQS